MMKMKYRPTLLGLAGALLAASLHAQDLAPAAAAASAPEAAPGCSALTARALGAELRASGTPPSLEQQARLLDEVQQLWHTAIAGCEGRARERAQRHGADNEKLRLALAERRQAGALCEGTHRDAGALQELARQAFGERRWGEAGSFYRKAETMWDLAAEQCSGSQKEVALKRREQSETDAHNAEFCAPRFERAREQTQKLRAAAERPAAEKQALSQQAEGQWREAMTVCKGNALELAGNNAQALARERGTPWVPPPATAAAAARPAPAAEPSPTKPAPVAAVAAAPAAPATPITEAPREIDVRAGDTRYKGLFVREAGQVVSGTGRVEWSNGDVYEGALLRSRRHGQGELVWANGQRYKGEWQEDRPSGRGQLRFANGDRFEGQVLDGVPEGEGEMVYARGDRYRGRLSQGVPHGRGRYEWSDGQVFDGDWQRDKPQGRGRLRFANGNQYEGEVADGRPHGKGRLLFSDGGSYEGQFEQGHSQGQGSYAWSSGDRYVGAWTAGRKHGRGLFIWANGDRWEGEFRDDAPTEDGTLTRKPS
ncbi:hypothetical protein G8A07_24945 [Roseateles sp. DAIF2]|uniref:MORN repeat-containing protein n=1 Tax=Roseateles sp. DAIF2 TaxID=2714952 RepID=UPI0018A2BF84|nr:hypothetical protein [Roseateles sp. DAIF2]QPF75837.1 hypothetical protein G8A07_24945 [Roseateles sp. DAIF2]